MLLRSDTSGDLDIPLEEVPTASFPEWHPGEVIEGNLEVLEMVGEGGMGVVWRVHHREWNRDLAVKMPRPALVESPTARERFLREAETWIDLGVHPHIVQCWFVKDISGLPSLFLDYLTGGSLKQWIDEGHIKPGRWAQILELAMQIAEGLAYAHSRGVIHRDVKPANLLIRGDERLCITDFGIVKTAGQPEPTERDRPFRLEDLKDLSLTRTGAYLGTPQYGAPEQWGTAKQVDHRADIYAVGVTLYEMCCGRRPFDDDYEEVEPEVLIERHLAAPALDPREYWKGVPDELARVVLTCLEKDPDRRPPSMEALREKLSQVYRRLTGQQYREPTRLPNAQRPDILNNRAVSLLSLGKRREARKVWLRGLRIESGHPECLYNLTQLDLRRGAIDGQEALRRLRQAKAELPLALLCLQEGEYEEARTILQELALQEQHPAPGLLHRVLGDALMYTEQYYAAEKAYQSALKHMPSDQACQERKRLASLGKRGQKGRYPFPSCRATFRQTLEQPGALAVMSADSKWTYTITDRELLAWDIDGEQVAVRRERQAEGRPPRSARIADKLLLVTDDEAFELWRLPELKCLGRQTGRLLAASEDLTNLAVRDKRGNALLRLGSGQRLCLNHREVPLLGDRLVATFAADQQSLCLVLANGRVAQPDEEGLIHHEDWPTRLDDASSVTCLAVDPEGVSLFVGYGDGRLCGYDFERQVQVLDIGLDSPIEELWVGRRFSGLAVRRQGGFTVIDNAGQVQFEVRGPACYDPQRERLLAQHDGHLCLFSLRPIRRLRRWVDRLEDLRSLHLGADGGRAASIDGAGNLAVWEVDEDHRVREKNYLLSKGRSYAEIVGAAQHYEECMSRAREAFERHEWDSTWRHLQRARGVPGYAQALAALDMNWHLLPMLRREGLEAVWERLALREGQHGLPLSALTLSRDGQLTLLGAGSRLSLFLDSGTEIERLWSSQLDAKVLCSGLERAPQGSIDNVIAVTASGRMYRLHMTSGSHREELSLSRVPLRSATENQGQVLYLNQEGRLGGYHLPTGRAVSLKRGSELEVSKLFNSQGPEALVLRRGEIGILNVEAEHPQLTPLPVPLVRPLTDLTFARRTRSHPLVMLGFSMGAVQVIDLEKRETVCQVQLGDDPITGLCLIAELSVGVASTGSGRLLFWDLESFEVLENLDAHSDAITLLDSSTSGRYLATSGRDGAVRLWETSWTTGEEPRDGVEWLPRRSRFDRLGKFLGLRGKRA